MGRLSFRAGLGFALLALWSGLAIAAPECRDGGAILDVDNEQVIDWKNTTHNQFEARAHVNGAVSRVFPDKNKHAHFEIKLGKGAKDTLEVIYNLSFGKLPKIKKGMMVEACGDYITSFAPSGSYVASPSGAIIHWVHKNPKNKGHDHGYITVDGKLFGQGKGR